MHVEGEKCPGCGREWGYRQGDGGKEGGILSLYHRSDCEFAPPQIAGATEEAGATVCA